MSTGSRAIDAILRDRLESIALQFEDRAAGYMVEAALSPAREARTITARAEAAAHAADTIRRIANDYATN